MVRDHGPLRRVQNSKGPVVADRGEAAKAGTGPKTPPGPPSNCSTPDTPRDSTLPPARPATRPGHRRLRPPGPPLVRHRPLPRLRLPARQATRARRPHRLGCHRRRPEHCRPVRPRQRRPEHRRGVRTARARTAGPGCPHLEVRRQKPPPPVTDIGFARSWDALARGRSPPGGSDWLDQAPARSLTSCVPRCGPLPGPLAQLVEQRTFNP